MNSNLDQKNNCIKLPDFSQGNECHDSMNVVLNVNENRGTFTITPDQVDTYSVKKMLGLFESDRDEQGSFSVTLPCNKNMDFIGGVTQHEKGLIFSNPMQTNLVGMGEEIESEENVFFYKRNKIDACYNQANIFGEKSSAMIQTPINTLISGIDEQGYSSLTLPFDNNTPFVDGITLSEKGLICGDKNTVLLKSDGCETHFGTKIIKDDLILDSNQGLFLTSSEVNSKSGMCISAFSGVQDSSALIEEEKGRVDQYSFEPMPSVGEFISKEEGNVAKLRLLVKEQAEELTSIKEAFERYLPIFNVIYSLFDDTESLDDSKFVERCALLISDQNKKENDKEIKLDNLNQILLEICETKIKRGELVKNENIWEELYEKQEELEDIKIVSARKWSGNNPYIIFIKDDGSESDAIRQKTFQNRMCIIKKRLK